MNSIIVRRGNIRRDTLVICKLFLHDTVAEQTEIIAETTGEEPSDAIQVSFSSRDHF